MFAYVYVYFKLNKEKSLFAIIFFFLRVGRLDWLLQRVDLRPVSAGIARMRFNAAIAWMSWVAEWSMCVGFIHPKPLLAKIAKKNNNFMSE